MTAIADPRAACGNLNLLRAALLVQVVAGHFAAMMLPTIPSLGDASPGFRTLAVGFRLATRFGPQAAVIFVVLSGFLVGGPLLQNRLAHQPNDFGIFLGHRLCRLVPTLVCALLLTALLDTFAIVFFDAEPVYRAQRYDFVAALSLWNLLGNFLGLQPTFFDVFGSNGPLWTLGYLIQFYVFGFAALMWTTRPRSVLAVTAPILAIAAMKIEWLLFFIAWLSGAMLALAPSPRHTAPYLACGSMLTVSANLHSGLWTVPLAAAAGLNFIAAARCKPLGAESLGPVVKILADFSYEIYAVHFPVGFFIFASGFHTPATSTAPFLAFLSVTLPTVAAAALLTRRLTKMPLTQPELAEGAP